MRRYGLLILLAACFGGLFGVARNALLPRLYRASATLQLPPGARIRHSADAEGLSGPGPEFLTELDLLESDELAARVAGELNLSERADFLGRTPPAQPTAAQRQALRLGAQRRLEAGLGVSIVRGTNLVRLQFTDADPALAAAIVNRFADDFIADRYERQFANASHAEQLVSGRLGELRTEFTDTQRKLLELQEALESPGFSPRNNKIAAGLNQLAGQERAARLRTLADRNRAELLGAAVRTAPGASAADPGLAAGFPGPASASETQPNLERSLENSLDQARLEQARLRTTLGPNHPQALAAAARVASLQAALHAEDLRLVGAAQQQAELDRREVDALHAVLTERLKQAHGVEPQMRDYALLERRYIFARTLYYRFISRLRTQAIAAGLRQANVYVVDRAQPPVNPIHQRGWPFVLECGLLSGAMVLPVVLFLHHRRDLWSRIDDLEAVTGLPALAVLPRTAPLGLSTYASMLNRAQAPAEGTATASAPQATADPALWMEALFSLRATLTVATDGPPPVSILVTSCSPGEGKSTISGCLAVTLAHGGRPVLLIDADLHRPTLHRRLQLAQRPGLTDVLSGRMSLGDAAQPLLDMPQLHILTSGPLPPSPERLLSSAAMRALLTEAARHYTCIVLDAPPVLAVQDTLVLAQHADCVIWVMRDLFRRNGLTRRARRLLEEAGAPVRGLVLNGVDPRVCRTDEQTPAALPVG